jgi:hypothetical protein
LEKRAEQVLPGSEGEREGWGRGHRVWGRNGTNNVCTYKLKKKRRGLAEMGRGIWPKQCIQI